MAEAVKNNGRKRRPPAHFNQVYNEDKYEGAHGRYYPSRTIQSLKQQNRQKDEPLNISQMAKLFSKFINSVNKKAVQFKDKIKEQQVQMMENKAISDKASLTFKNVQGHKDEQQKANSKKKDNIQKRDQLIRQQATKQKYQQKNQKKLLQNQSYSQQKNLKAQPLKNDSLPKNIYPTQNRYSIDEMAKASRQQYIKSLQKGVDPNIYKHKQVNAIKQSLSKPPSLKPPTKQQIQPQSNAYFRQTGKLFKRASFHIGIAYNIHIQNLKQHYPNFTPQQLDPTYYSRKLKILSEPEIQKIQQQYIKNNKIKQQMYKKQMEQKIQQQRKQTPKKQQFTQKNNHLMNSFMNNNKQLNCIDLIDQEPDLMIQQNKSIQERNLIQENKKEENIIDKNNQIKKEQQIQQIQQQGPNQEKSQEIN